MSDARGALQTAKTTLAELRDSLDRVSVFSLKSRLAEIAELLDQASAPQPETSSGSGSVAEPATATPPPVEAPAPGSEAGALQEQIDQHKQQATSFNSLMVHEIRKPMTAIRGYVDMLAKPGMIGTLNEMQQQFIDTVRVNAIRMESLVTDISDINKLTYDRMVLDPKMTTYSQILLDINKQMEPLLKEYGHTFNIESGPDLPVLNVDSKQIAKVLMHLLRNAVYYTPKSGAITLKAERAGNDLKVTITDTGIGMKPEDIARLGEAFFRADHELVTGTKGYGLGIPVTMGFLKLMKTNLQVESNGESGFTASFTIPGMDMSSLAPESSSADNSSTVNTGVAAP